MEIIDYLRIAKRRLWIIILVPVLAAGATAAVVLLGPTQYLATATVDSGPFVSNAGSPFTGTQATAQFTGSFTAAAQSPNNLAAVSSATGVDKSTLLSNVVLAPVGASSDMQVSYTGTNQSQATKVVQETTSKALDLVFSTRARQAAATRDQALASAAAANKAVSDLAAKSQVADPVQAYQSALNQLATLQQQQAQLRATGNSIGAAALDAPIQSQQKVLATYVPLLGEYNQLDSARRAADSDLSTAQTDYRNALTLETTARGDGVIYLTPAAAVSKTSSLVSLVLPVFGAGVFLAIILVLLIEVIGFMRRSVKSSQLARASAAEGAETPDQLRRGRRSPVSSEVTGSTTSPTAREVQLTE